MPNHIHSKEMCLSNPVIEAFLMQPKFYTVMNSVSIQLLVLAQLLLVEAVFLNILLKLSLKKICLESSNKGCFSLFCILTLVLKLALPLNNF